MDIAPKEKPMKRTVILRSLGIFLVVIGIGLALFVRHISWQASQIAEYPTLPQIKKALLANPNDPVALRSMASQDTMRGNYPEAIQYQQKSVSRDPQNRFSRFELAILLLHEHQKGESEPLLQALAKSNDTIGQDAAKLLAKIHGKAAVHAEKPHSNQPSTRAAQDTRML